MAVQYATVTAGRLRWDEIRDIARQLRFRGHPIEMLESSGLIERDFTFKAEREVLRLAYNLMKNTIAGFGGESSEETSVTYEANRRAVPEWPLIAAMRQWLSGSEQVPTLAELLDRFGHEYRDIRYYWSRPDEMREKGIGSPYSVSRSINMMQERDEYIAEFGFPIPCREAIDALAELSPIVELGAGTGAWARLIANRGATIVATDSRSTDYGVYAADRAGTKPRGDWHGRWFHLLGYYADQAVRTYSDNNVFCSWPTLEESWLLEAAQIMRSGRKLAVIFEECCGNAETWAYIEGDAFKHLKSVELPCWYGIHDRLEIFEKVSP